MEKIKKRIATALTQMQLAENEAHRLRIQKKPVTLDNTSELMLGEIDKLSSGLLAASKE